MGSNLASLPVLLEGIPATRNYQIPDIIVENADTVAARQEAVRYLNILKKKIEYDHQENMARIWNNHREVMNSIQYHAANNFAQNYLSGLNSEEKAKIEGIEAKPYVWENTLFGFQRKSEGITIKINRR